MQRGTLGLTSRQELYLRGLCRGESRKTVAGQAFVSEHTVRNAMRAVYDALGVKGSPQACYLLGRADQQRRERVA